MGTKRALVYPALVHAWIGQVLRCMCRRTLLHGHPLLCIPDDEGEKRQEDQGGAGKPEHGAELLFLLRIHFCPPGLRSELTVS